MADLTGTADAEAPARSLEPGDGRQRQESGTAKAFMSGAVRPTASEQGASIETLVPEQDLLTVARGGGLAFLGNVTTRVINYVYSAALIWGLGAESFGVFTLALSVTTLVGVIANLGLDLGIVRYGAIHARDEGQTGIHRATVAALRLLLPTGLLSFLALWASANPIATGIFGKPELAPLVRALALSIPFMTLQSSLLAATRALKIMRYSVIVSVVQPLVALVLAIPLMTLGLRVLAVSLSLVASWVLGALLAAWFYLRLMRGRMANGERYPLGEMLKFSLPLSATKWIEFANERTEVFFLGLLPGAVDIGIYSITWRLAVTETVFRQSLEQIVAPFSSDLSHRQEIGQLEALYKTTAKWSLTGALVLFLIFVLFAETIMRMFDPAFVSGSGALVLLGFAQLINAATGPCGTLLIMSGRSDLSLLNIVILFSVGIALDWLLIPRYGLAGAATAGASAVTLVIFLRVLEVWLTLKIHPFKWSAAKPVAAGLLSAAVIYGLRTFVYSGPPVVDVLYMVLLVAVYAALILLLKLDAEDMLVISAVRRRIADSHTAPEGKA